MFVAKPQNLTVDHAFPNVAREAEDAMGLSKQHVLLWNQRLAEVKARTVCQRRGGARSEEGVTRQAHSARGVRFSLKRCLRQVELALDDPERRSTFARTLALPNKSRADPSAATWAFTRVADLQGGAISRLKAQRP